jgi:hypothetical protein
VTITAYCISGVTTADFTLSTNSGGFNSALTSGSFTTGAAAEIVFIGSSNSGSGGALTPGGSWLTAGANYATGAAVSDMYQIFSTTQTGVTGSGTFAANCNWTTGTIGFH